MLKKCLKVASQMSQRRRIEQIKNYLSFVNEKTIDWQTDKIILKMSADIKPLTAKPSTNLSQIKTIMALMTNKKSPKVTMVTGNVKKTRIGFTKTFSKPSTTAIMIEVVNDATVMPDMK